MFLFKKGSKLQLSLIFLGILLVTFTGVLATIQKDQISIDSSSQTVTSQSIIRTKSNYEVVSETKNNINVMWFPVRVSLIDKEYNITINNLEGRERSIDIDAFFKAITGGIDNVIPGSIKLSYLTTLTKTVDDYTRNCTIKQVTLSKGELNETARNFNECLDINNPKIITYRGWKAYPVNEVRDKIKEEIILQKIDNNGRIILLPNSVINLNLAFKTGIVEKSDGGFGNDGQFGLLLDGVSYHPVFNTSYDKRYVLNYTTNDALDTNYTHNITFGFTGNSSEIGSGTYTYGTTSLLACDNLHVVFNGTTEIDAWVDQCNKSSFSVYFRNQFNNTRNTAYNELYEIYYDPIGSNYQRPQDWAAIWLGPSDNFAAGINTTKWIVDNTSGDGNSTWINLSSTDGVITIGGGTDNADDGCFRGSHSPGTGTNFTQSNWQMDFLWKRRSFPIVDNPNNKGYGVNNVKCGVSPNTDSTGARVYGDPPQQRDDTVALRLAYSTNSAGDMRIGDQAGVWIGFNINHSEFGGTNRTFLHVSVPQNSTNFPFNLTNTPVYGALTVHFRDALIGAKPVSDLDYVRVYQIVQNAPSYTIIQENRSSGVAPTVQLNNPPNATSNTSTSHKFNSNMSDDNELKNATLYYNITGSWAANQTVNISGTTNSTNFSVANILPGIYLWNVQACDTSDLCQQASSNFTFKVLGSATSTLKVRACTASTNNFGQGTYDDPCDGNYSVAAACGSNGTINDFLSCDDGNAETHSYNKNRFAGVHIQTFNSSITDCSSIGDVLLCYEWWTTAGDSVNCTIEVDANGNSSYTSLPANTCPGNTCPFTTPNPGLSCINVTNLENWTCGNFFGSNGTRAVARNLIGKSDIGAETLSTDAFFFNVTYMKS